MDINISAAITSAKEMFFFIFQMPCNNFSMQMYYCKQETRSCYFKEQKINIKILSVFLTENLNIDDCKGSIKSRCHTYQALFIS